MPRDLQARDQQRVKERHSKKRKKERMARQGEAAGAAQSCVCFVLAILSLLLCPCSRVCVSSLVCRSFSSIVCSFVFVFRFYVLTCAQPLLFLSLIANARL